MIALPEWTAQPVQNVGPLTLEQAIAWINQMIEGANKPCEDLDTDGEDAVE